MTKTTNARTNRERRTWTIDLSPAAEWETGRVVVMVVVALALSSAFREKKPMS
jgi:hypothetical protein